MQAVVTNRKTLSPIVLLLCAVLVLSGLAAIGPVVNAQSGQWTTSLSLQAGLSQSGVTISTSGSGSAVLNVNGQGQITGTGNFHGSITESMTGTCTGGGAVTYSESDTYSGRMTGPTSATITVTASESTAPTSVTVTCPNPNPPPASFVFSVPVPAQLVTAAGTYNVQLTNGYVYTYSFPAPTTGSFTISVSGGATTTTVASSSTTVPSTTTVSSSTTSTTSNIISASFSVKGLGGPPGLVAICSSISPGNCHTPSIGEVILPGDCIETLSMATSSGIASGLTTISTLDGRMQVVLGQNGRFCTPTSLGGVFSLYWEAFLQNQLYGRLHVSETYNPGLNVRILTPIIAVKPTGTEFTIQTSANGTTVMVFGGSVLVTDLTTNSSVSLQAGQTITVVNSTAGMTQQEMQQGVAAFNPSSAEQWWSQPSVVSTTTGSTSSSTGGKSPFVFPSSTAVAEAIVAGVAIIAIIGAVVLQLGRRKEGAQQAAQPSPPAASGRMSQRPDLQPMFCGSCGSPVKPGAAFCENCGQKI